MEFQGFNQHDFQIFSIEGLDERMDAIRSQLQPKFQLLGRELAEELSSLLGEEMFLHIAKHARRTVNPPKDTWLAIGPNKRGYKQYPHFQVGLFDDHVFIWLAYIYELPNKAQMADNFINSIGQIKNLVPKDFMVSTNHMQKDAVKFSELDLKATFERFKNVKKAEFLIGLNIDKNDSILSDGPAFTHLVLETYKTLLPIYKLSYK